MRGEADILIERRATPCIPGCSPAGEPATGTPQAVVLDTNVVMALWLFNDPRLLMLRVACESRHLRWLAPERLFSELRLQLTPQRCERYGIEAAAVMARCESLAEPCPQPATPGHGPWPRCTDPDDQAFIDLALGRRAAWLLSRDRAVLKLARRAASWGTRICKPEDWQAPHGAV